jgi:hypothetical protein
MLSCNSPFAAPAPYTSLYLHHSTDCGRHHIAKLFGSFICNQRLMETECSASHLPPSPLSPPVRRRLYSQSHEDEATLHSTQSDILKPAEAGRRNSLNVPPLCSPTSSLSCSQIMHGIWRLARSSCDMIEKGINNVTTRSDQVDAQGLHGGVDFARWRLSWLRQEACWTSVTVVCHKAVATTTTIP